MLDRRAFLLAATAAGALAPLAGAAADTPGEAALNALLDDFAQRDLATSPELATSLGLDKGALAAAKSRLADRSYAQIQRDKAEVKKRLGEMKAIDRSALTGMAAVNYDTVQDTYARRAEGDAAFDFGGGGSGNPYILSQLNGAYQQVPAFLDTQHSIETAADCEAYLSRLDAFGAAMDQEIQVAEHDGGLGIIPPDFAIANALTQLREIAATPAHKSQLVNSLVFRAKDKAIAGEWDPRATALYNEAVVPAVNRQIALLESWRPGAVHDAGCWRLKDGEAFYAASVREATTTSMTPEEVHALGLELCASLSSRIDGLLKAQGMTQGSVGARLRGLYLDKRYWYPNTDAGKATLIGDLNRQVKAMQARLPQYFATLPKAPVEIRRVPQAIELGQPGGYYDNASLDGSRPGIYWINLRNTVEVPKWTLPTLTHHEAIPGHHLQLSLQQEATLPLLRKINFLSAYGEGWAVYAEQLADEMGVYKEDPIGQVGYLQSFLFRACRLVVDTGMHAKRWSREQAVRFMMDTDGDNESMVATEIERYAVWPGQACSYMIGAITWDRLRTKAKAALGAKFDIRRFHDAGLLAGAMPLSVLERRIDGWIAAGG